MKRRGVGRFLVALGVLLCGCAPATPDSRVTTSVPVPELVTQETTVRREPAPIDFVDPHAGLVAHLDLATVWASPYRSAMVAALDKADLPDLSECANDPWAAVLEIVLSHADVTAAPLIVARVVEGFDVLGCARRLYPAGQETELGERRAWTTEKKLTVLSAEPGLVVAGTSSEVAAALERGKTIFVVDELE